MLVGKVNCVIHHMSQTKSPLFTSPTASLSDLIQHTAIHNEAISKLSPDGVDSKTVTRASWDKCRPGLLGEGLEYLEEEPV